MESTQIPSFRVQISDYCKEEGYTTFSIKVYSLEDNSFQIIDRYRNIRSLWEEIRKDAIQPDRIPEFPPKRWFGSRSREFLETRKSALQNFFNTLLDSPDKNVFEHIMKYFKKLARNREARDAIQNIEDAVENIKRPKTPVKEREEYKEAPQSAQGKDQEIKMEDPKETSNKRNNYKDSQKMVTSKDYNETCTKIVDNFTKKLIDLGYTGADAIQDIMAKGQNYVKHFKESGLNQEFKYETNLLGIPKGNDDNIALLDTLDEEEELENDEVNDKLQDTLSQLTEKYYKNQFEQFISMNDVTWRE
mmetsp:Transcript_6975/g.6155  ORF Transcript_6975/g.6155 Transcript_6975/m.6155 type:complete len:304 (+) Transcript_6975:1-912(+)